MDTEYQWKWELPGKVREVLGASVCHGWAETQNQGLVGGYAAAIPNEVSEIYAPEDRCGLAVAEKTQRVAKCGEVNFFKWVPQQMEARSPEY